LTRKQAVGKWGEKLAEDFLIARGYTLVERNARTSYGEIDLVMKSQEGTLVFVEVKTRTTKTFGHPEESITPQKRMHMINSAEDYILSHPDYFGDWRVDVLAIYRHGSENTEITWFENAIT
jgi:putative endonuclease